MATRKPHEICPICGKPFDFVATPVHYQPDTPRILGPTHWTKIPHVHSPAEIQRASQKLGERVER